MEQMDLERGNLPTITQVVTRKILALTTFSRTINIMQPNRTLLAAVQAQSKTNARPSFPPERAVMRYSQLSRCPHWHLEELPRNASDDKGLISLDSIIIRPARFCNKPCSAQTGQTRTCRAMVETFRYMHFQFGNPKTMPEPAPVRLWARANLRKCLAIALE
jgi:hypothetical protein